MIEQHAPIDPGRRIGNGLKGDPFKGRARGQDRIFGSDSTAGRINPERRGQHEIGTLQRCWLVRGVYHADNARMDLFAGRPAAV